MEFRVDRTSEHNRNTAPCDGATKKTMTVTERYNPKELEGCTEIPENHWIYSSGTNQRIEDGVLIREVVTECWVIKINSLNQLMSFLDDHPQIVMTSETIEIYDTQRE